MRRGVVLRDQGNVVIVDIDGEAVPCVVRKKLRKRVKRGGKAVVVGIDMKPKGWPESRSPGTTPTAASGTVTRMIPTRRKELNSARRKKRSRRMPSGMVSRSSIPT